MTSTSANNSQTKRKEIYKYEAPWMVYAMNWSIRPDKRFRLALGSFVEEYNNKVKSIYFYTILSKLLGGLIRDFGGDFRNTTRL